MHGAERVEGLYDLVETDFHGRVPAFCSLAAVASAGRRPAPRRSSATLAMMVTTASVARIEAAAKAPAAW
ncbi:hypothetical protein D3C86_2126120 [compost metagenome]